MRQTPLLRMLMLVLLTVPAACTTSTIAPSITAFNQAATGAKTTLDAQLGQVDKAILSSTLDAAASKNFVIDTPDCRERSDRCRLYLVPAQGAKNAKLDKDGWPFSQGALGHNVGDLMNSLVAYTGGLAKIADAKTSDEVESATGKTNAAIVALAGTVEELQKAVSGSATPIKAKISAYSGPITGIVGFGLRYYVERIKRTAIRDSVVAMDPVFGRAMDVFQRIAEANARINEATLRKVFLKTQGDYFAALTDDSKQTIDAGTLSAYRTAAENLDRQLGGKPTNMFKALRDAHADLVKALNGGNVDSAALWQHLQTVFSETERFAKLVGQLADATKT
jgi:hypothetical protein